MIQFSLDITKSEGLPDTAKVMFTKKLDGAAEFYGYALPHHASAHRAEWKAFLASLGATAVWDEKAQDWIVTLPDTPVDTPVDTPTEA